MGWLAGPGLLPGWVQQWQQPPAVQNVHFCSSADTIVGNAGLLVCWSSGCRPCAQSHAVLKSLSRAVRSQWSRPGQPMGNLQCFECLWQSIVCVLYCNHAYESVMHAGSQQRCAESSKLWALVSVAIPISQSLDGLSLKYCSA